jgi:hypothetical protein
MELYFPKYQPFEDFLSRCAVVREKPMERYVALSKPFFPGGRHAPVLYLAYPDTELKFETVLTKVAAALEKTGCPCDRRVAISTLALIVETHRPGTSAVDHANDCITDTHAVSLMQSVVLPGQPRRDYEVRFGDYAIRAFNPKRFLYWASRGKSEYPIDLRELSGWASLERQPTELPLIDWQRESRAKHLLAKWGPSTSSECFLDCYYSDIAFAVARQIKSRLKRDVLVLESGAMVSIAIEDLLSSLFLKIISYFTFKSSQGVFGWATYCEQSGLHANFPSEQGVADCREWLAKELGFTALSSESPLDKGIETYCRFLQRAHGHRIEGRHDEAFLHFAIALDLLMGTEGRSADSVAQRVALVVHRQLHKTLDDQIKRIKHLYGVRSKYVHEGQAVSGSNLEEIERSCTEVLWTLLSISSKAKFNDLQEWIRRIDYLYAAIRAGAEPAELEFESIGIPLAGRPRNPPLRVLEMHDDSGDEFLPRFLR